MRSKNRPLVYLPVTNLGKPENSQNSQPEGKQCKSNNGNALRHPDKNPPKMTQSPPVSDEVCMSVYPSNERSARHALRHNVPGQESPLASGMAPARAADPQEPCQKSRRDGDLLDRSVRIYRFGRKSIYSRINAVFGPNPVRMNGSSSGMFSLGSKDSVIA